jgi:hypothetical protein
MKIEKCKYWKELFEIQEARSEKWIVTIFQVDTFRICRVKFDPVNP